MSASIPAPKTKGITVYGRAGCGYSEAASRVPGVTYHQLDHYYQNPREFLSRAKEFIGNHHTFPVVFINGKFIGGYDDLVKKISK